MFLSWAIKESRFHLEFQLVNHYLRDTTLLVASINDDIVKFIISDATVHICVKATYCHGIDASADHKCFTMIIESDFFFRVIINRFSFAHTFFYKINNSLICTDGGKVSKTMTLETLRVRCRWMRKWKIFYLLWSLLGDSRLRCALLVRIVLNSGISTYGNISWKRISPLVEFMFYLYKRLELYPTLGSTTPQWSMRLSNFSMYSLTCSPPCMNWCKGRKVS